MPTRIKQLCFCEGETIDDVNGRIAAVRCASDETAVVEWTFVAQRLASHHHRGSCHLQVMNPNLSRVRWTLFGPREKICFISRFRRAGNGSANILRICVRSLFALEYANGNFRRCKGLTILSVDKFGVVSLR